MKYLILLALTFLVSCNDSSSNLNDDSSSMDGYEDGQSDNYTFSCSNCGKTITKADIREGRAEYDGGPEGSYYCEDCMNND
jgi:hypothetical protein